MLVAVGCVVAGFNGIHLGKCWIMLRERFPECREPVKTPYPLIAEKAYGPVAKCVPPVSFSGKV